MQMFFSKVHPACRSIVNGVNIAAQYCYNDHDDVSAQLQNKKKKKKQSELESCSRRRIIAYLSAYRPIRAIPPVTEKSLSYIWWTSSQ